MVVTELPPYPKNIIGTILYMILSFFFFFFLVNKNGGIYGYITPPSRAHAMSEIRATLSLPMNTSYPPTDSC